MGVMCTYSLSPVRAVRSEAWWSCTTAHFTAIRLLPHLFSVTRKFPVRQSEAVEIAPKEGLYWFTAPQHRPRSALGVRAHLLVSLRS